MDKTDQQTIVLMDLKPVPAIHSRFLFLKLFL